MGLWARFVPGSLVGGLTTALALGGCTPEERATLVPLLGCGIEGELTELRLTARGDFSPAVAPPVQFGDGTGELAALPQNVTGVTVEGLFGPSPAAVGRTARLRDEGELPVYFSPRDRLCPVESDIPARDVGAMAVGDEGDVVLVGGRGVDFALTKDVLHYRDTEGVVRLGVGELPWASIGQSLHAFGRHTFLAVGGTTQSDELLARAVTIRVGSSEGDVVVGTPVDLDVAGAPDAGRAYHGGVELGDGRILIVGGCRNTSGGTCVTTGQSEILGSGFFIERVGGGLRVDANLPPLQVPRFGHQTLVSRDGIIFVVGGRRADAPGLDGEPEVQGADLIELLLPGLASWAPFGPPLTELLAGRDIVGATLVEGGQLVIALSDGAVWSVDELHAWPLRNWCTSEVSNCFTQTETGTHSLFALPGERVLADNFLLPVSQLRRDGSGAVDISMDETATDAPPGARSGALMALLDDGSVALGGGLVPASGALPSPVMLRFRPALDGPDEREPLLEDLPAGSLILHDDPGDEAAPDGAERISIEDNALVLRSDPLVPPTAVGTWVHVRGFLSRRFRLQASIETTDETLPAFVFSFGAVARNTLVVRPDGVEFIAREPSGGFIPSVGCVPTSGGLDFVDTPRAVVVEVSPEAVELRHQGDVIVRCPWEGEGPVAVGLGVVGPGSLRARSLGLSRG